MLNKMPIKFRQQENSAIVVNYFKTVAENHEACSIANISIKRI